MTDPTPSAPPPPNWHPDPFSDRGTHATAPGAAPDVTSGAAPDATPGAVLGVVLDVVVPLVGYYGLRAAGAGIYLALLGGAVGSVAGAARRYPPAGAGDVGAVRAEQHDEWIEGRRYLGLDVLARAPITAVPDYTDSTTEEAPTINSDAQRLINHTRSRENRETSRLGTGPCEW